METKYNEDIIEYPLLENKIDKEYFEEINVSSFIQRKWIDELEIEKYYPVDKLERISTKYGQRILATLCIDENKIDVFLPKRFNEKISENCIRYWNEMTNLGIKFLVGSIMIWNLETWITILKKMTNTVLGQPTSMSILDFFMLERTAISVVNPWIIR